MCILYPAASKEHSQQYLNINKPYKTMLKEAEIPEGVTINIGKTSITVKGPKGELKRRIEDGNIKISIDDKSVKVSCKSDRRKIKAHVGTMAAHIRNMIAGVTSGYTAKMKAVHSHFPMKVNVEGSKVVIQNFLGERKPRVAKTFGDVKVEVKKDEIVITGISKEEVGQTAASIETAAKVKKRDRRVFQDGIYITQKPQPAETEVKAGGE
jgi:large subunit ribosomal protein L6